MSAGSESVVAERSKKPLSNLARTHLRPGLAAQTGVFGIGVDNGACDYRTPFKQVV